MEKSCPPHVSSFCNLSKPSPSPATEGSNMALPLAGRTVALAEGRQLEELAQMLEKEGATCLRCPMLSILDAPDDAPVLRWLDELQGDRFGWVILLTGEGMRRLLTCAGRHNRRDAYLAALARTR